MILVFLTRCIYTVYIYIYIGYIYIYIHTYIYIYTYKVHRCGPGGSMRACHAAGPGSIPGRDNFPGWGFFGFFSPLRQMSGSFRTPRSPNIIWPSLSSSIIINYGRQLHEMWTPPKITNIHTYTHAHTHTVFQKMMGGVLSSLYCFTKESGWVILSCKERKTVESFWYIQRRDFFSRHYCVTA